MSPKVAPLPRAFSSKTGVRLASSRGTAKQRDKAEDPLLIVIGRFGHARMSIIPVVMAGITLVGCRMATALCWVV